MLPSFAARIRMPFVKAGAIGASQAMLGRAVFTFVKEKELEAVERAFLESVGPKALMVTGVSEKGAVLLEQGSKFRKHSRCSEG